MATSSEQRELPVGWTQLWDPTSQTSYFWAHSTSHVQWERPGLPGVGPRLPPRPCREQLQPWIRNTQLGIPDGWTQLWDSTSQSWYYWAHSTSHVQWERPGIPVAGSRLLARPRMDLQQWVRVSQPKLPVGWTQLWDPTSQTWYYWEQSTSHTQWERPGVTVTGSPSSPRPRMDLQQWKRYPNESRKHLKR